MKINNTKDVKYKSCQSNRTLTIVGDEKGYRFFIFDDSEVKTILQHPIDKWEEYFTEYKNEKECN